MTQYEVKLRLFLFGALVGLVFLVLVFQTWYLQAVRGEEYRMLADQNRFREVILEAPRGVMYDRNGSLLVRNRPTYNLVVIPAYLPEERTARMRVLARLAEWLDMPLTTRRGPGDAMAVRLSGPFPSGRSGAPWDRPAGDGIGGMGILPPKGILDMVEEASLLAPYQPIVLKEDLDATLAARITEESVNLPGVQIEIRPLRDYLTGSLTAHVIGYTGAILPALIAEYEAKGYAANDLVGLAGLELQYEEVLRSFKGRETIEVDVSGRKLRTVGEPVLPRPGNNLKLTLDTELQRVVVRALERGIRNTERRAGVAIAMDPRNGQILAMASLPGFDNNLFIGGISTRDYMALVQDKRRPLINHAIAGLYPPGSTYKIIPALGALEEGVVTPNTIIIDEGVLWVPNQFFPDNPELAQPFYCWNRQGHGPVNFIRAIAVSCDVYFYYISGGYAPSGFQGLGVDRLIYYAELFGMGQPTGIDLPGEAAGLVPTPKWKRINYAETWVTGDTYNMGIGQGFVLTTPLQILNAYAAIANGGLLYKPYLVQEILDADGRVIEQRQPQVVRNLLDYVSPENLALVQQGLRAVTQLGGTAEDLDVPGIPVAGKTGTAEFCDNYPKCLDKDGRVKTSHAWFVAYAPADNPEIAVIVFVYGGGEGSLVAAPIVAEILRAYFGQPNEQDQVEATPTPLPPGPPPAGAAFTGHFLGGNRWGGSDIAVTGFVLDRRGMPVPGVTVNLIADLDGLDWEDPVTAQATSGANGQFDFTRLDKTVSRAWRLELADYAITEPLRFEIEEGYHYWVELRGTW
ncbi:MAG: penicillin-binding protein 2 [Anaerolineae bacterium]|nr:penicillin-binding protein 2 [Anaerolineae bacterium]MDW8070700.1 penicillin-binding protein 2 [Anaerolineae bacterium]